MQCRVNEQTLEESAELRSDRKTEEKQPEQIQEDRNTPKEKPTIRYNYFMTLTSI